MSNRGLGFRLFDPEKYGLPELLEWLYRTGPPDLRRLIDTADPDISMIEAYELIEGHSGLESPHSSEGRLARRLLAAYQSAAESSKSGDQST